MGVSRVSREEMICEPIWAVLWFRVFALACLADDFVRSSICARHPDLKLPPRSGLLFTADEVESAGSEFAARFEPGTFIVTVGRSLLRHHVSLEKLARAWMLPSNNRLEKI